MDKKAIQTLIGRTVVDYAIDEDREGMTLTFQDGSRAHFSTYSECCSCTWIESLDCPDNLLGTIQDIKEIDMPNLGNINTQYRTDVDEVQYYGLQIVTEKGHCVIDYRNDSNGYYGGDMEIDTVTSKHP